MSNPMPSPIESIMAMFLMSMTNFGDYYGAFERTQHEIEAKVINNICRNIISFQTFDVHKFILLQFLFVVYMAIVAILLVNMLIAMMGNTYQKIAETRNEWQRQVYFFFLSLIFPFHWSFHVIIILILQWARIVLVVERGVSPNERLKKLMDYSQPMSDGRRALVLRLNQSVKNNENYNNFFNR